MWMLGLIGRNNAQLQSGDPSKGKNPWPPKCRRTQHSAVQAGCSGRQQSGKVSVTAMKSGIELSDLNLKTSFYGRQAPQNVWLWRPGSQAGEPGDILGMSFFSSVREWGMEASEGENEWMNEYKDDFFDVEYMVSWRSHTMSAPCRYFTGIALYLSRKPFDKLKERR